MTKRLYTNDAIHDRLKAVSEKYGVPMQTLTELALKEFLESVEAGGLYGR